ncbi:SH3 domain-containing protein [Paracoccus onubensis]|uniref:COG3650 family protein n=1 Tax=Paracoccus onubensis TaxID=1675788 RepID=UPI002730A898|nr:SH3 domain-containing protein [Paracoccus onubensis]MDP0929123.1 SH3 domain-containing protein [Paracoccus onubensis]
MLRTALALILLATPALATPEYILPTLFDVTGVEADDVLNIRAEPSANAEIIGTLAPDATDIEVVEEGFQGKSSWFRVNTGERSGWVSQNYMTPHYDVWKQDELPDSLRCFGTEPFWNVKTESGNLTLSTPDAGDDTRPIQSILVSGYYLEPRRAVLAPEMTLTATPEICSDGMSDQVYGMDAMLILHGEEPRLLSGCCTIQPRHDDAD